MEYVIMKYHFDENTKRLQGFTEVRFVLRPELKIVDMEYKSVVDNPKLRSQKFKNDEWQEARIKDWLFRKSSSPFDSGAGWSMVPAEFDEEDKQMVRRLWMLEDL